MITEIINHNLGFQCSSAVSWDELGTFLHELCSLSPWELQNAFTLSDIPMKEPLRGRKKQVYRIYSFVWKKSV